MTLRKLKEFRLDQLPLRSQHYIMLRTPLRTLPKRLPTQVTSRRFISETTSRRGNVYQSQTSRPIVVASLGLAALFGWTAAVLTVGGKKDKKHVVEQVKEKVKEGKFLHLGLSTLSPFSPVVVAGYTRSIKIFTNILGYLL